MSILSVHQRESLRRISGKLLRLHKLLLDQERDQYEQANGPISSTGEYLNLVLAHERFEWLRQLSGLIVQIDELLAPRSHAGYEEAHSAEEAVRSLLVPAELGGAFQQRYWAAIQSSPEVLIAHRELMSALKAREQSAEF